MLSGRHANVILTSHLTLKLYAHKKHLPSNITMYNGINSSTNTRLFHVCNTKHYVILSTEYCTCALNRHAKYRISIKYSQQLDFNPSYYYTNVRST